MSHNIHVLQKKMTHKLLILHTGGTISMSEGNNGHVAPSKENPLLTSIKTLHSPAKIDQEPIFNIPSPHINLTHWTYLKTRIEKAIFQENYTGIVITHGTDTLEETAYFLELSINTDIPPDLEIERESTLLLVRGAL